MCLCRPSHGKIFFSVFNLFTNLRGILGLWDIFIFHSYCLGFTNFSRCFFLLQLVHSDLWDIFNLRNALVSQIFQDVFSCYKLKLYKIVTRNLNSTLICTFKISGFKSSTYLPGVNDTYFLHYGTLMMFAGMFEKGPYGHEQNI